MKSFMLALAVVVGAISAERMSASPPGESPDRPAVVAGSLYPSRPAELTNTLVSLFAGAPAPVASGQPLALIAPHAGYVYRLPLFTLVRVVLTFVPPGVVLTLVVFVTRYLFTVAW